MLPPSPTVSNMQDKRLKQLIEKYSVPAPRYTSYPTVPYWDDQAWNEQEWLHTVNRMLPSSHVHGISLYIHLPFCESLCTYCGCNTRITKNHEVEEPYISSILREWRLYRQYTGNNIPIADIHIGGGTPTFFSPANLEYLISGIVSHADLLPDASFSFEAHPANTTKEHLEVLYRLGFRRLSLGIQDFNPQVQFIINRRQSEEDVWKVLYEARETGYTSVNFDLIYGLPLQHKESIVRTIETVANMKPDRISFYSYAHVPWLKPGQRRYTEADLPAGEEKLALYLTGKQLLAAAGYVDVGMDHFALPHDTLYTAARERRLHRNFMGYTEKYTPLLVGLGVSAISDSWYGFAQNVKQVEAYTRLVNEGRLPLLKGHILTDDDLVIRRHILDIMCNGRTSWLPSTAAMQPVVARLSPLEADGLIRLYPGRLEVTPEGKSLLRNICMAFDNRMADAKPVINTFSNAV